MGQERKMEEIMGVLSGGGCIWYEYSTSTPLLVDSDGVKPDVLITYEEFNELHLKNTIEITAQIAQGDAAFRASIFRHECDRYELTECPVDSKGMVGVKYHTEPLDKAAEQREERPAREYDRNETLRKLVE